MSAPRDTRAGLPRAAIDGSRRGRGAPRPWALFALVAVLAVVALGASAYIFTPVRTWLGQSSEPPAESQATMAERMRTAAAPAISDVDARRQSAVRQLQSGDDTSTGTSGGAPAAAAPVPPKGLDVQELVGWKLSAPRIVAKGTTVRMPQGDLASGRVIEAKADATVDGRHVTRRFRIELNAFRPGREPPAGMREGVWRVNGAWTLYPEKSDPKARSVTAVRGVLSGDLHFNPLEDSGRDMDAAVRLIGPYVTGSASRDGTYAGTGRFDGILTVPEGQDLKALASQLTGEK